jgi:hypothetical protein
MKECWVCDCLNSLLTDVRTQKGLPVPSSLKACRFYVKNILIHVQREREKERAQTSPYSAKLLIHTKIFDSY